MITGDKIFVGEQLYYVLAIILQEEITHYCSILIPITPAAEPCIFQAL